MADAFVPTFAVQGVWREERVSSSRYRWNNAQRGSRPYVILQWTLSGEGAYEHAERTFRVPPGHAFVVLVPEPSFYSYPAQAREPWVFSWINLQGELAYDLFGRFQRRFGPVVPLSLRGAAAASWRRLLTLFDPPRDADRRQVSLHVYTLLLDWWRELSQPRRGEEGIEWAIRFCREHFREAIAIKQLAQEAGLSREHFTRVFSDRMQETPAAFLRRLRLAEAVALLQETRLPLAEIARRSGFFSARHLMLTHQRVLGSNPTRTRRG